MFVITISRLCGSRGSTIARRLAKELNVPLYDRNLLRIASDESGIDEALFAQADERVRNGALFRISKKIYEGDVLSPSSSDFTSDHNLFSYQAKVLRELAQTESYVVVGRCADFVLKDMPNVLRVFITADENACVKHEMERDSLSEKEARAQVQRINKERANYYKYYTDQTWSHAGNYDLCLNSTHFQDEDCVKLITQCLQVMANK